MTEKSRKKMSWERKEFLRWNKKLFYHFWMPFIEENKAISLGRWEPDFNINLCMCFIRVGSRGPITFKMMLSVTIVNSSFQLPIFCHKDLHLRCCIGLVLNIVIWSMNLLKDMRGHLPWSSATSGKYEKLTLLDTLKIHFQRFFALD